MGAHQAPPIHQDRTYTPMRRLAEVAAGWHCDEFEACQIARELLADRTTSYVYNARYKLQGRLKPGARKSLQLNGLSDRTITELFGEDPE